MKFNLLQKLSRRERRVMNRIDKANWSGQSPMIAPPTIQYELADRIQAIGAGGVGVIQQMVKQLGLAEDFNRICPIFKMHLPYSEADHVLNIAFNLLAAPAFSIARSSCQEWWQWQTMTKPESCGAPVR